VIGIVVDDAIVVGESAYLHVEQGITGEAGAIGGANMVAKPVFFAVITTIMMFIPFLLLTGPIQALTGQISLVVIAVLTFSLIEAFFILPAHLRHLKRREGELGFLMRIQRRIANSLVTFATTVFRPFVAKLIQFRYVTASVFVGLLITSCSLLNAGIAPSAMFPEVEGDMIAFSASFPEGTTFERRNEVRAQVDAGIEKLNANGKKDFGVDFDLISAPGTITSRRRVEGYLGLSDPNQRREISTKMIADKLEEYVGPIHDEYRVNYGITQGGTGRGGGLF